MPIWLKKAFFLNRAPFERLELNFNEKGVYVFSAVNGKGKTTILSHIVDSFYELARPHFPLEFKGSEGTFYRLSSGLFSLHNSEPSIVQLTYSDGTNDYEYLDIRGQVSPDAYGRLFPKSIIKYNAISSILERQGCVKHWSISEDSRIKQIFNSQLFVSFPSYRYEFPGYLTSNYSPKYQFSTKGKLSGYLPNPIEIVTGLSGLTGWLMDLIVDVEIYKLASDKIKRDNFNKILSEALSGKFNAPCRLGIAPRNVSGSRISIVQDTSGGIKSLYPTIYNISSGESALISLFGSILQQADTIGKDFSVNGIVVIDEIDKHLHIRLQKEILPKLLGLFPNIQFFVSSHSPFLSMGLSDVLRHRSSLIDLDSGGLIEEPSSNELYQEVYEIMIHERESLLSKYEALKEKIDLSQRPLIITEGKTDWKHLKAALLYFNSLGDFVDCDVEIFEYEEDFGDSKLDAALKTFAFSHPRYPVIGIFDCDEANGGKINKLGGRKQYGDKVWGVSIPVPGFRSYNNRGISIEFLYTDDDIRREDENGRRLFISSEFNRNGRLIANESIGVKNIHDVEHYTERSQEKIQCDEVIDIYGKSYALSKESFANAILNKEPGFEDIDFSHYRPLFDIIRSIVNSHR